MEEISRMYPEEVGEMEVPSVMRNPPGVDL